MKYKIIIAFFFLCNSFNSYAQCNEAGHSNNAKDSWLSCQTSAIPNSPASEKYHWIHYDLGYVYPLGGVQIWNYNVANETGKGIKEGEIFYGTDGETWHSGGTFQLPEANGQTDYLGWEGIVLGGINARFIFIVAYSNWETSSCVGLSEVRFNIARQTTAIKQMKVPTTETQVFPNPTTHVLNIDFGQNPVTDLMIVNASGHEIMRRRNGENLQQIDVSSLPAGMYLVHLITDNQQVITKRFIKAVL